MEKEVVNLDFYLTKDTLTVKEVAEICKKLAKIELKETNDEVPNLGFSIK